MLWTPTWKKRISSLNPSPSSKRKLLVVLGNISARANHPAALNFGDCFAYALAETTREPLLFKGDDFELTDV